MSIKLDPILWNMNELNIPSIFWIPANVWKESNKTLFNFMLRHYKYNSKNYKLSPNQFWGKLFPKRIIFENIKPTHHIILSSYIHFLNHQVNNWRKQLHITISSLFLFFFLFLIFWDGIKILCLDVTNPWLCKDEEDTGNHIAACFL